MKLNWTSPISGLAYVVMLLVFVEVYHLGLHNKTCKTYSEWVKTLPADIRSQLRDRR